MARGTRSHLSHWGAFQAEVEDGAVVAVRPWPQDPDPSPLLENIPGSLRHPARIAQPMIRAGWLDRGPGPDSRRGSEPFVPVSWATAIDRVARDARISPDEAAARVFQERFPQRPLPETPDAVRAALLEGETSSDTVSTLAAKRIESVRATLKKAGVDNSRLTEARPVDNAQAGAPQVKLDFAEPESLGRRE